MWCDTPTHGKVILRHSGVFEPIRVTMCIQQVVPQAVPPVLEWYRFMAPLTASQLRSRLTEMGYSQDVYIAAFQEHEVPTPHFIMVSHYAGPSILRAVERLWNEGPAEDLVQLAGNLGACLGHLHSAGLICDDTHPNQFVVTDSLAVYRIDVGRTKVRSDILPGHKVLGGVNAELFKPQEITTEVFRRGMFVELAQVIDLPFAADRKKGSGTAAIEKFRESYIRAGGSADALSGGRRGIRITADHGSRDPLLHQLASPLQAKLLGRLTRPLAPPSGKGDEPLPSPSCFSLFK
jgi:hypothetical protein